MALDSLSLFWRQHPAILYALALLLGAHTAFHANPLLLIPLILIGGPFAILFFFAPAQLRLRLLLAIVLFALSFSYVHYKYQFTPLPVKGLLGQAHINFSTVTLSKTPFGKVWIYRGNVHSFIPDDASVPFRNIPFTLRFPDKEPLIRPKADREYSVRGILKGSFDEGYFLTVSIKDPWHPLENTWSLAETRNNLKTAVKNYIQKSITGARTSQFLAGIATGEFDDRLLKYQFGRFGLQHIMAISGFHFSIIASILSLCLGIFLPRNRAITCLILALSSYFLFLGCSASIMRAWITIIVTLIGNFVGRSSSALNSLGVALIAVLFVDPLMCLTIGFELSFLSTAAILFFFKGSDHLMQKIWLKRPLSELIMMTFFHQHAFLLLSFFRQAIALTIAVHLIALPMMLFYFQKFPWISLIYNLFFPFLVSISMLLLLVGIFFDLFIPSVAAVIHTLNSHFTQFLLNFTFNMPPAIDFVLYVEEVSADLILIYLCLLLWAGIILKIQIDKQNEQRQDMIF